jgi:hypothetical protein
VEAMTLYQRDYMLRMIEQFSVALGHVIFQRRNQRFNEALELITQAMKELLGLNSKLVRALSIKDLIALISTQGHFDAGKGLLLSDMLKAEGEVRLDAGEEAEGWSCHLKSLELLLEIRWMKEAVDVRADADERIEGLLSIIKPSHMPAHTMELLVDYYEGSGQLAKAEDMLFFLLESYDDKAEWVETGLRMFGRWQEKQADELEQGGLTEAEVRESYDLLVKMKQTGSVFGKM